MKQTFSTTIQQAEDSTATGIQVPPGVVAAFGKGKKPKVLVTLNGYTYRSTVAVMDQRFKVPVSAEHRQGAGVQAGDHVNVTLEVDTEPREVEVPDDLAAALDADPRVRSAFDALAYSHRKEHVRAVQDAKQPQTRQRRIDKVVEMLRAAGA